MGNIIFCILFIAVVVYISNRRAFTATGVSSTKSSGNRRVSQIADDFLRSYESTKPQQASPRRDKTPGHHTPVVAPVDTSASTLLDSTHEGESVTGFKSGNKRPKPSSTPEASAATAAHYARWRQAVIDATVLTPLQ